MRRSLSLVLATAMLAAVTACTNSPQAAPEPQPSVRSDGPRQITTIATGLEVPWSVGYLPDGSALVTERDTRKLLKLPPTGGAPTTVTTIDEADSHGEGGLLGIAVSPAYATDHTVFLYYTTTSDNRVAKLDLGKDGARPQPIVTGIPISGIHNGGRLAFGPDGYLYATTGDASERGHSQDLSSLGGKILRMTTDGKPAPGNPFDGSLVWSYGHRNVQGLAWDKDGRLFATEFGQNTWDEVNRIEKGKNYGWPIVEGISDDSRFVNPIAQWHTQDASCSGAAMAGQTFIAACLRGERLWLLTIGADGNLVGSPRDMLAGEYGRLRSATVAPDGSVWITTSNRDGRGTPRDGDDRIIRLVGYF